MMTPDPITAWLAAHPWLSAADLMAFTGLPERTILRRLARLLTQGQTRAVQVEVMPWPRCRFFALAGPNDPLPAPLRLLRLEALRALHVVLNRQTLPASRPSLIARLRGEPDGPPGWESGRALAGLADGWLLTPDRTRGLLLRWDDGERHDQVEWRLLRRLEELHTLAPPVALVCVDERARQRWLERGRRHTPVAIHLACAADLVAPIWPGELSRWRDLQDQRVPPPSLAPLAPVFRRPDPPPPPDRRLAGWVATRLALSSTDLEALAIVARQPLVTPADLAWALACSARLASRSVARLEERRLLARTTGRVGRGGAARRLAAGQPPPGALWATRAGVGLLAAVAGERPARYRAITGLVGGRLARSGRAATNRLLTRLVRHPRHTRDLIHLRQHVEHAVWRASQAGQTVCLLEWQGPVTRPVSFPTDDPSLIDRRWRPWRSQRPPNQWELPQPRGKVEPDVVARLRLGDRRLTLLIEWDRGTEGRGHLRRKLRHYVGWGASPAARNSLALVITTTPRRERLIHELVSGLARARFVAPPLWTTTIAQVRDSGFLATIWWTPDRSWRQSLAHAPERD